MDTEPINIGHSIVEKLKEKDLSVAWLGRQVHRDGSNLGRLLKDSKHIHSELLLRISKALRYDFFSYYTNFLHGNNYVDKQEEL